MEHISICAVTVHLGKGLGPGLDVLLEPLGSVASSKCGNFSA